jgi:hypothetical protein
MHEYSYCSEGYGGPAVRRGIACGSEESGYNVGMVRVRHVLDSWKAIRHRAQLSVYLRLKGIVPATTGRRQSKHAGK